MRSRRLGSNSPGTRKWKRPMERKNLDEERERNRKKKQKGRRDIAGKKGAVRKWAAIRIGAVLNEIKQLTI